MENKLLLSIEETTQVLGISRSLLYKLIWQKNITTIKVGRARKILVSSLTEYIARCIEEERDRES